MPRTNWMRVLKQENCAASPRLLWLQSRAVVMWEIAEADMAGNQHRLHSDTYDDSTIAGVEIRCWRKTDELYQSFTFGHDVWGSASCFRAKSSHPAIQTPSAGASVW